MNTHIFRSYDIRGVYKKDIDEEITEKIGVAFGIYNKEKNIAVGRDVRLSSPSLKDAFISGLIKTGKNVSDIGELPLGAGMFFAWKNNTDFVYITASHLSKEWNGLKFFRKNGTAFSEKEIFLIRDIILKNEEKTDRGNLSKIQTEKILTDYINYISSKINSERRLKIILDCGNGCAGLVVKKIFEKTGFDVETLFEKPDGNFPNRNPDPQEDDLIYLKEKIKENSADMGIAYDGDSDRMFIVDDSGTKLTPEQVSIIIIDYLSNVKGDIIANVECTSLIDDAAEKSHKKVHRIRVGHTHMINAVKEKNACFGVERSGHFMIPSLIPLDDSLAISAYVACMFSKKDKISDVMQRMPKYPSERIALECSDDKKFIVIKKLKQELEGKYKINTTDGIRIDMNDGWILIRASNTGALIRLTMEAKNKETLERIKSTFLPDVEGKIKEANKSRK